MKTHFPNPTDLLNFELTITPDEGEFSGCRLYVDRLLMLHEPSTGMYKNATFPFTVAISSNYPHQAPKVRCTKKVSALACRCRWFVLIYSATQIYHPNLDLEGNVCL